MGFSKTGITHQQDRFDGGKVVPFRQGQDLRTSRRLEAGEVKIAEFFQDREPGGLNPVLLTVPFALGDLLLKQRQQETVVRQLRGSRILSDLSVIVQQRR